MNKQFRSYAGRVCVVIGIGEHTQNGEKLVAYCDWEDVVHFMPSEIFFGKVEVDGKVVDRFTPV